jgi:hypothetical protein
MARPKKTVQKPETPVDAQPVVDVTEDSTFGHSEVVNELEPESESFVKKMLKAEGIKVTDSLVKELGSRVADVIRSVK